MAKQKKIEDVAEGMLEDSVLADDVSQVDDDGGPADNDDSPIAETVNDNPPAETVGALVGRVMEASERELKRLEAILAKDGKLPQSVNSQGVRRVISRCASLGTAKRAGVSESVVEQVWAGILMASADNPDSAYIGYTSLFSHGDVGYRPARQSQADGTGSRPGAWLSTKALMAQAPAAKGAASRGPVLSATELGNRTKARGIDLASINLFGKVDQTGDVAVPAAD